MVPLIVQFYIKPTPKNMLSFKAASIQDSLQYHKIKHIKIVIQLNKIQNRLF